MCAESEQRLHPLLALKIGIEIARVAADLRGGIVLARLGAEGAQLFLQPGAHLRLVQGRIID